MPKFDREVDDILLFIGQRLRALSHGKQIEFAQAYGLSPKNLTDLKNYAKRIEEGDSKKPDPNIRTIYRALRGLLERKPIDLETIQPVIVPLGGDIELSPHFPREDYGAVPLVEGSIAAGPGRIVSENIEGYVLVYKPEIGQRFDLIAVKLANDAKSMEPTLHPGDIVIIDTHDKQIEIPGIFAVRKPGPVMECSVKRIKIYDNRLWLLSDNPQYPPEMSPYDNLDDLIIGRVICSWTSWLK